jgi:preprotein translocase subunit SecF
MSVIGYRKIYYSLSGAMVASAILAVALWQFRYSIDFVGGTRWEISLPAGAAFSAAEFTGALQSLGLENITATPGEDGRVLTLRFREIDEKTHQQALTELTKRFPGIEERRFETVGPTISKTLRQKAAQAVAGVLIVIAIYVTWAFRQVSRPVPSWKYGAVTLLTLFHDVMAPIGLFAVLGRFKGVEVDSQFIVALLVTMGFSVHDTIVVFDRLRENIRKAEKGVSFAAVVEKSVRETFMRSLNTSLTLIVVLLALWFWGPETLRWFSLTLLVGTVVGTYSSIFIASPLILDLAKRRSG